MRTLITGGSGFVGSYFYEALHEAGDELVILDLVRPAGRFLMADYIEGDVRDPAVVRRAMEGCDRVLHLAAAHHDFGISDETYFSVNRDGTRVVTDAMTDLGLKDVCFYSSAAVYGAAPEPRDETVTPRPLSAYGASKLAGEEVIKDWANNGDSRRALVIRPTVLFGPRNYANMYSLIRQIHRNRFVQVGAGRNIKSLAFVENIVAATQFLWGKADLASNFEVFNYADTPHLDSAAIAAAVYDALGKRRPSFRVPMNAALLAALPFDLVIKLTGKNLPVSSARIKKLAGVQTKFEAQKVVDAGFRARYTIQAGVEKMTDWYLDQGRSQTPVWHTPPAAVRVAAQ